MNKLTLGSHMCKTTDIEDEMFPSRCHMDRHITIKVYVNTIRLIDNGQRFIINYIYKDNSGKLLFTFKRKYKGRQIYVYVSNKLKELNYAEFIIVIKINDLGDSNHLKNIIQFIKNLDNYNQKFVDIISHDKLFYMNGMNGVISTLVEQFFYFYFYSYYKIFYFIHAMFVLNKIFDAFYLLHKNKHGYFDSKPENIFFYCTKRCYSVYIGDLESIVKYNEEIKYASFINLFNKSDNYIASENNHLFNFGVMVLYILYFVPLELTKKFDNYGMYEGNNSKNTTKLWNELYKEINTNYSKILDDLFKGTTVKRGYTKIFQTKISEFITSAQNLIINTTKNSMSNNFDKINTDIQKMRTNMKEIKTLLD